MSLLLLLLACADPVPLPPSVSVAKAAKGRMVRVSEVQGYLARPTEGEATSALLLLVDHNDDDARATAEHRAAQGSIVLAITPKTSTTAARAYLQALPGMAHLRSECLRQTCP